MTTRSTDVDGRTIGEMFRNRAQATPSSPAFSSKLGGSWQVMTWAQSWEQASEIAGGLLSLGVKIGDRVAILCNSRVEWILCDMGLVLAGGITVPIYPSSLPDQCAYILNNSETSVALVENAK